MDIILKSIKESHAKNQKDTSIQAETIPFPEELIESLVLSAMRQGGSREEQTVLALNELGENLGFCGVDEDTTIFFEETPLTREEKIANIERIKNGNMKWKK